jgi:hypothetical protein
MLIVASDQAWRLAEPLFEELKFSPLQQTVFILGTVVGPAP